MQSGSSGCQVMVFYKNNQWGQCSSVFMNDLVIRWSTLCKFIAYGKQERPYKALVSMFFQRNLDNLEKQLNMACCTALHQYACLCSLLQGTCFSRGLDLMISRGPFQPLQFCDSVMINTLANILKINIRGQFQTRLWFDRA